MPTLDKIKKRITAATSDFDFKATLQELSTNISATDFSPYHIDKACEVLFAAEEYFHNISEDESESSDEESEKDDEEKLENISHDNDSDFSAADTLAALWTSLADIDIATPSNLQKIQKLAFLSRAVIINEDEDNNEFDISALLNLYELELEKLVALPEIKQLEVNLHHSIYLLLINHCFSNTLFTTFLNNSSKQQIDHVKNTIPAQGYKALPLEIFFSVLYSLYDVAERKLFFKSSDPYLKLAAEQLQRLESTEAPFAPKNKPSHKDSDNFTASVWNALSSAFSKSGTSDDDLVIPSTADIISLLFRVAEYDIKHSSTKTIYCKHYEAFQELCNLLLEPQYLDISRKLFAKNNYQLLVLAARIARGAAGDDVAELDVSKVMARINSNDLISDNEFSIELEQLADFLNKISPNKNDRVALLKALRYDSIIPTLFLALLSTDKPKDELIELWGCLTAENAKIMQHFLVNKQEEQIDYSGILIVANYSRHNATHLIDALSLNNIIIPLPIRNSQSNFALLHAMLRSEKMGRQLVLSLFENAEIEDIEWLFTELEKTGDKTIFSRIKNFLTANNYALLRNHLFPNIKSDSKKLVWLIRKIFKSDAEKKVLWDIGPEFQMAIIATPGNDKLVQSKIRAVSNYNKDEVINKLTNVIMIGCHYNSFDYDAILTLLSLNIPEITESIAQKIINHGFDKFINDFPADLIHSKFKSTVALLFTRPNISLDDEVDGDENDDEEYDQIQRTHPFRDIEVQLKLLKLIKKHQYEPGSFAARIKTVKTVIEECHEYPIILEVLKCQVDFEPISSPDKEETKKYPLGITSTSKVYSEVRLKAIEALQKRYIDLFVSDHDNHELQDINSEKYESVMTIGQFKPSDHRTQSALQTLSSFAFTQETPTPSEIIHKKVTAKNTASFCSGNSFC